MKNRFKNLKRNVAKNNKLLIKNEKKFHKEIKKLKTVEISSPIKDFIEKYKIENLKIKSEDQKQRNKIMFMILKEIELLIENQDNIAFHIKNVVQIFEEQNLNEFLYHINTNKKFIQHFIKNIIFIFPDYDLVLQKKGKFLNKTIFRKCFLSIDSFGQIKNKKDKNLQKPLFFRNHEVKIETKSEIKQIFQKQEEMKKNKLSIKKIMKWPEKKEIKDFSIRLRFTDTKDGKEKCVYFKDHSFAYRAKNNAIVQKLIFLDRERKLKFRVFSSIFKIKQAEFFYDKYLKHFLREKSFSKVIKNGIVMKNSIKIYLKNNFPNLYDSGYKQSEKLDFYDNSHINLKKKKKEEKQNLQKSNILNSKVFATIINPEKQFLLNKDDQFIQQNEENFINPFKEINSDIVYDEKKFNGFLKNFQYKKKKKNIKIKLKKEFMNFISLNSTMILNFNKFVLKNDFEHKDFILEKNEIEELIFDMHFEIEKGNKWENSFTLNKKISKNYISFEILSSFKIDFNTMKTIIIKISDFEKKILFEKIYNLYDFIDNVFLENNFFLPLEFNYKNCDFRGVLDIGLIFMPRNLEISHLLLNKELLDSNFENFSEILRKCQNFIDYKKWFFKKEYLEAVENEKKIDYFSFKKHFLKKNSIFSQNQENLLINSLNPNYLEITKKNFYEISMLDLTISQLTKSTIKNIKNNINFGEDFFVDFLLRLKCLISPEERILLYQTVFGFLLKNYLNLNLLIEEEFYSYDFVKYLNDEINLFLKDNNYLNKSEEFLFTKIVFKCYLVLNSNEFDGKSYEIFFSKKYFSLISNIILINKDYLNDNDLLFIILVQILCTKNLQEHSDFLDLVKINNQISIFKFIMKNHFMKEFDLLNSFMINFDDFLADSFFNSFSDYIDPVNFQIYCDFKNFMIIIFIIQNSNLGFLNKFKNLEIPISSFIDILFIIFVINKNYENFKFLNNKNFSKHLKSSVQKSFLNFEEVIIGILELLIIVCENNFFMKESKIMKRVFLKTQQKKDKNIKNLNHNLKVLKITKKTLKEIIKANITDNNEFSSKITSIFQKRKTPEKKDSPKPSKNSQIEEDIFFEIANDQEQLELTSIESNSKLTINSLTIYLNNLEPKIAELSQKNSKWDKIHNCLSYDIYKFQEIAKEFFNCNEIQQMELYNDLSIIYNNNKRISFIQFLLPIILNFSNNDQDIKEMLDFFCDSLSSSFFENGVFDQIVAFFVHEIFFLGNFFFFDNRILNQIQVEFTEIECFVQNGFCVVDDFYYNFTHLVVKNFESHSFVYKKYCLHFNSFFCEELKVFFLELKKNKEITEDFERFVINVEVKINDEIKNLEIPFKINFLEGLNIFCKYQDPIFFDTFYSEKNKIEKSKNPLIKYYDKSGFYKFSNAIKRNIDFIKQRFEIKFKFKDQLFLTAYISFGDKNHRISNNLLSWNFLRKEQKLKNFIKNEIKLVLSYQYFFLDLKKFIEYLKMLLVEKLDKDDIFDFIKLNSSKMDLYTTKGKKIDQNLHIFNLADYEKAFKSKTEMVIYVIYDK